jgi:hypothetical protein
MIFADIFSLGSKVEMIWGDNFWLSETPDIMVSNRIENPLKFQGK